MGRAGHTKRVEVRGGGPGVSDFGGVEDGEGGGGGDAVVEEGEFLW